MTTVLDLLPAGYGYVLLVAVGYFVVCMGMAFKVGGARKQYSVPYPQMYHTDPKNIFNCIQRVHQNTLETQGWFLSTLLVAGLKFPNLTAGLGALYLVSRVMYAQGYYTGDPKNRQRGGWGFLVLMIQAVLTVNVALDLLGISIF